MADSKLENVSVPAKDGQAPAAQAKGNQSSVAELPPVSKLPISEKSPQELTDTVKLPEPIAASLGLPDTLKSLSQESLIGKLDDNNFHLRQAALKELSQREVDLALVAKILPEASLNTATQVLQLVDGQQFGESAKVLRDVHAIYELREFAKQRQELFSERLEQRALSTGTKAEAESKGYVELAARFTRTGLPEGIGVVEGQLASGRANTASENDLQEIFSNLQYGARKAASWPNSSQLYSGFKQLPWKTMSTGAALEEAAEICDAIQENTDRVSSLGRLRESDGLSFEGFLVNRTLSKSLNSLSLSRVLSETDVRQGLYESAANNINKYHRQMGDGVTETAELSKLAGLIRLEQKFINLTAAMDSRHYDHTSSTVLKPLMEQWLQASAKGDLKALSQILANNEDIAEVMRTKSALAGGSPDCLFIETILRNPEIPPADKLRWRQACQAIGSTRPDLGTETSELDQARKSIIKLAQEGIKDCFAKSDLEGLEAKALQCANAQIGINTASSFARSLEYFGNGSERKFLNAAKQFLGYESKDFDTTLVKLLNSEGGFASSKECKELLNRFSSEHPADFIEISNCYRRLDAIEANIHLDRPAIQISLASQHKDRIINSLLSQDPESLTQDLLEANRFSFPLIKSF